MMSFPIPPKKSTNKSGERGRLAHRSTICNAHGIVHYQRIKRTSWPAIVVSGASRRQKTSSCYLRVSKSLVSSSQRPKSSLPSPATSGPSSRVWLRCSRQWDVAACFSQHYQLIRETLLLICVSPEVWAFTSQFQCPQALSPTREYPVNLLVASRSWP